MNSGTCVGDVFTVDASYEQHCKGFGEKNVEEGVKSGGDGIETDVEG